MLLCEIIIVLEMLLSENHGGTHRTHLQSVALVAAIQKAMEKGL